MIPFKNPYKLKFYLCLVCLFIILLEKNFAQSQAHEQYINNAYQEWVKATNSKDIKKWSSFLAKDAIFHPPDHPALTGEKAIRDYYIELFEDKHFSLKCKQERVAVSKAEDLAWATGSCEATFTGPDGKKAWGKSKWAKIWVRLPNGEWKCRINSWNSKTKK